MKGSFTALDFGVLVVYLVLTTVLGVWLGRGQKDAKDYFIAGRRIPWWAILFSVVATETSALTFISIPGLAYTTNLSFLQVAFGYLIGRVVIAYTLLPRYFQGELVTAYSLLERRFGLATRRFASIAFMTTRAFGDSVRVFATAIPVALIIGPFFPEGAPVMPVSIIVLGLFTLVYTYHGGMRAVIWTDVLQSFVYIGGGIAALVLIGRGVDGGWSAILAQGSAGGKLQLFDFYTGFDRPHTIFAGLLGGAFLSMASHGADQLIVQRLLASHDLREARLSLIGSGVVVILQFLLFLVIGIGLFAFYEGRVFDIPDQIFPTFIVEAMPPGMTGIVIAAVLAAAMSTVSSSLNSLAASSMHDIYLPFTKRSADDPKLLALGRLLTLFWAVILIGGALLYRAQGTPVVTVALSIASFTYGGLLGGFFLALLWSRAIQRDAILGMSVGIIVMTFIVFARQIAEWVPALAPTLAPVAGIAWPWFVLIGTSITMLVGIASSYTHPVPTEQRTTAGRAA